MTLFDYIALPDLVIAAALVLFVVIGAARGLVKSLSGLIIVAAAFIGASFVANALAEPVAQWLGPVIEENILSKLAAENTNDAEALLAAFHFSGESLQQMAEQVMTTVKETGMDILSAVTDSVAMSVSYAAVYLVAFLVLLLAVWLLLKPVQLLAKLPVLRTADRLGGGALGLVWGALLVFAAVWLMLRFDWVLTQEMVDHSRLLHFFATNSPLSLLASL